MKYQMRVRFTAKDGKAVTDNLLPEIVVSEEPGLFGLFVALSFWLDEEHKANLPPDNLYDLAKKIESDVEDSKYKWQVEKQAIKRGKR